MKNRIIAVLLVLTLCLTQLGIVNIAKAEDLKTMVENEMTDINVYNFSIAKGSIYALNGRFLFKQNEETNKFEPVAAFPKAEDNQFIGYNLYDDPSGELVAMTSNPIKFYKIEIENEVAKLSPAYSFTDSKDLANMYLSSPSITENYIYGSTWDETSSKDVIAQINKSTGEVKKIEIESYPDGLLAYKNDSVLFLKNDYSEDKNMIIMQADASEIKELKKIDFADMDKSEKNNINRMLYNKDSDTLMLISHSFAYKLLDDGKLQKLAFLDMGQDANAKVFDKDNLVYISYNEAYKVRVDSNVIPQEFLRVSGYEAQKTVRDFNKLNPTTPVLIVNNFGGDTNTLAKSMKASDACDIYAIDTTTNIEPLVKHEYLSPLEGSETITQNIARMYPFIQKAINFNGKPYLYPLDLYAYGSVGPILDYAYNVEAFKEVGITEDQIPKTYSQFLDLIARWQNDISANFKDYTFISNMQYTDLRNELSFRILNTNNISYTMKGETPSYDTPIMQHLFEKLSKTDFYGFYTPNSNVEYVETSDKKALISVPENVVDIPEGFKPLPLKLSDDTPVINTAALSVFAINALSNKKELAIKFIEYVASKADKLPQTKMFNDVNEPIINESMLKSAELYKRNIANLQKELQEDKAKGGKRAKAIEEEIKGWEDSLGYMEKYNYTLSKDELDWYNQRVDTFVIQTNQVMDYNSEQMQSLFNRFYENNIDYASFLRELDRYVKMMTLEGN